MSDKPQFEFPEAVRELAERNVEQARSAYNQFIDMARKVQDTLSASQGAMTSGATEMQTQIARLPRYDAKVRGLLPYTSAAKRALEGAMDEASELGDDYVDTGHLLLGILRDSESAAAKILAVHDVTRERVRKELERLGPSS